jgi:dynein heavy chain, axonemal
MAEYDMWLDRESEFNKLLEQLKTPFAEQIIERVTANQELVDSWNNIMTKVSDDYKLARENYEYLSTIQDYLIVSIIIDIIGAIKFT